MQEEWWERPVCYICDCWWVFLILLVLALTGWFTRDYWLPAPPPAPTATPSPTFTPEPTPTRVEDLGTGDVQVTLTWESVNDLDLWVTDPSGDVIYYRHKTSASGGKLDVDANAGCGSLTSSPVENIFWSTGGAPSGTYTISVHYYAVCQPEARTPFTVRLLVDGQMQTFDGTMPAAGETVEIHTFTVQR